MEPQEPIGRSLHGLAAALGEPRRSDLPGFQGFPPVDAEEIARDLDLYVRAAEAGQRGEPAASSDGPDAVETAIESRIERRARADTAIYAVQLQHHDAQIRRTFLSDTEFPAIEAACRGLLAQLDEQLRDSQGRLMEFWRDHIEPVESEFQAFRARHGLERSPRLVSGLEKALRSLALAALAALGVFLHGRLLAGNAAGLARLVPAALWSVFTVIGSLCYAKRGFPALAGRGFRSKLVGLAGSAVFLGWIFGIQLLAAHHRDVWVAHAGHVSLGALWRHVALGLLALDGASSWLPALLGFGLSAVATFIAVGMDDRCPGYGAIGRRRAAALEVFHVEATASTNRLTALQSEAQAALKSTIEAVQKRETEANLAIETRDQFHRQFVAHLDDLAEAHGHLCRRYREINAAVQNGNVPLYFVLDVERPACLADPGLPEPPRPRDPWSQALERLQQFQVAITSLFAEAKPARVDNDAPADEPMLEEVPV